MADHSFPSHDHQDFQPWKASDVDLLEPWDDPVEHRDRERRQIRRYQFGFATLGCGLMVASLFTVGQLIAFLLRLRPVLMVVQEWEFQEETAVVFCTLVGAGLLWGHWPDESWRRRSGLLLLMFLADLVLWSVDHATTLGFAVRSLGHEPFRHALGHVLGWSEFALIASLSAGMAAALGEPKAVDLGRAVRSLTTVGASVWFAYFVLRTDWSPPIWPLRDRPLNLELLYLWLGSAFLSATILIQVTMLCLYAGRTCGRTVRAIHADEIARESALWTSAASRDDRDPRPR